MTRAKPKHRGEVLCIIEEVENCVWRNNSPFFVKLLLDNGQELMAHPSQLRKVNQ